ncbi:hypothetical protein ZWY2020_054314 [Hordeum vulgare]|nr:hypothetical protein ZWY2020_054314 [Hordeum vulgare]
MQGDPELAGNQSAKNSRTESPSHSDRRPSPFARIGSASFPFFRTEFGDQAADCLVIQKIYFSQQNIRWKINQLFVVNERLCGRPCKCYSS